MRTLKVSLSFVALVISLVAGAAALHLVAVPDAVTELLVMVGGLLMTLGYTPMAVSAAVAQVCGKISGVISAVLALHLGHGAIFGGHQHVWSVVVEVVGFVGVILGYLGRYTPAAAPAAAKLDQPPPAR